MLSSVSEMALKGGAVQGNVARLAVLRSLGSFCTCSMQMQSEEKFGCGDESMDVGVAKHLNVDIRPTNEGVEGLCNASDDGGI